MKARIIRNTLLSTGSSVAVGIIGFLLIPFMLDRLGATAFGLVSLAGVFLAGYTGLLELGFQTAITRTVAAYHAQGDRRAVTETVATGALFFFVLGVVTLFIGFATTRLLAYRVLEIDAAYRASFESALRIIFVSYLIQLPTLVFLAMLEGMQRFDVSKGVHVVYSLLTALGTIVVLHAGKGYVSVVAVTVGAYAVQFALYVGYAYRLMPGFSLRPANVSRARLREIMGISRYVFLGKLAGLVYHESDRVIIGVTIGSPFLAAYEVLFKLPRYLKTVSGFGTSAILPAATELHAASDLGRQRALFLRGLRFNLFFSVPVVTAAMFLAQPFLLLWVGAEYAVLAPLLQLLLLWTLLSVISSYGGLFLLSMNVTLRESTYLTYGITATKLVIVLATIYRLHIASVVIGNVVGFLVVLPFLIRLYLRALGISWTEFSKALVPLVWPAIVSLAITASLASFVQGNNFLELALLATVWCGSYWAASFVLSLTQADRDVITDSLFAFTRTR